MSSDRERGKEGEKVVVRSGDSRIK